jgi:hypothetical protein
MKRIITPVFWPRLPSLAVAFFLSAVVSAVGFETDLRGTGSQFLFSPTFFRELDEANRATNAVSQLEALYRKFDKPAEQAEIELTIARIFCQRTGLVDPAESIKWYDKGLVRDLPSTALAKQFILRGNMHERLKHNEEALADYVRGLLICLQFNLPATWPKEDGTGKLQPPPRNSGFEIQDEGSGTRRLARQQQSEDYRRESEMIRREQDLLMQRFYYVDAIKRVLEHEGLQESFLRTVCEKLTNRKDRVDEVLRRVREANPRPWP